MRALIYKLASDPSANSTVPTAGPFATGYICSQRCKLSTPKCALTAAAHSTNCYGGMKSLELPLLCAAHQLQKIAARALCIPGELAGCDNLHMKTNCQLCGKLWTAACTMTSCTWEVPEHHMPRNNMTQRALPSSAA